MRGALRVLAIAILTFFAVLLLLPVYAAAHLVGRTAPLAVAGLWHRLVLALIGVRVQVTGRPDPGRPLLILANHVSWLDISILASLLPVSFVAKQEVAEWPGIGRLARLQRSVFVDRSRRHSTGRTSAEIGARLAAGDAIVLFAEGTSGDGMHVLPFRSALIDAVRQAIGAGTIPAVQPLAIAYTAIQGVPLGRGQRPLVAWYGSMLLLPHLRRLLSLGAIDVHVAFGPSRRPSATEDRKALAAQAEAWVRRAVTQTMRGRMRDEPEPAGNPELHGGCRQSASEIHRHCVAAAEQHADALAR